MKRISCSDTDVTVPGRATSEEISAMVLDESLQGDGVQLEAEAILEEAEINPDIKWKLAGSTKQTDIF